MQTVENRFIAVIAIIYAVGVAGFIIPSLNPLFIWLTPINILGTFIIAWIFHKKWELNHFLMIAVIGMMGFFIELAGVKTDAIFGSYNYGATLGKKWQSVPYLIGINWAAMIFYTSSLLAGRIKNNLGIAFLGASIMTIYDYFLEPVAMRYDFWHWKNEIIPLYNYFCWFVIAYILHLVLQSVDQAKPNKVHAVLFLIMAVFFVVLNLN
jgi:putative membrane protein